MPANLHKPFDPACCEGTACGGHESAAPCGCDMGCKPKPYYCQQHLYRRALPILEDAIAMADDRADVLDGEDGFPRPDAWMQMLTLLQQIEEILK